jgi:hypothetical protein
MTILIEGAIYKQTLNNGTKTRFTFAPLTFILSPDGGEGVK